MLSLQRKSSSDMLLQRMADLSLPHKLTICINADMPLLQHETKVLPHPWLTCIDGKAGEANANPAQTLQLN